MKIAYTHHDGRCYPKIQSSDIQLGRYGQEWMEHLCRQHPQRFTALRMQGKLEQTAQRVEQEALERQERWFQQLLEAAPLPASDDVLERARHLNQLRLAAEEQVLEEIVRRIR